MTTCGIKHGLGDQTCIREHGHDGLCWSKYECRLRDRKQAVRSEWHSKDGVFKSHHAYKNIQLSELFKGAIAICVEVVLNEIDFRGVSQAEAITNGVLDYLASIRPGPETKEFGGES